MPAAWKIAVAPAVEPVSLAEAKAHCRVSGDEDDSLLELYIAAERGLIEEELGRALITQDWDLALDAFPDGEIRLPRSPLQSIVSVTYLDDAGVSQVWSSASYRVDTASEPGRFTPAYGEFYPTVRGVTGAVVVRFRAGYGAAGSAVPANIRLALLLRVRDRYDIRGDFVTGNITANRRAADALLASFRVRWSARADAWPDA